MGKPYAEWPDYPERPADRGTTRMHRLRNRPRNLPRGGAEPLAAILPPLAAVHARLGATEGNAGAIGGVAWVRDHRCRLDSPQKSSPRLFSSVGRSEEHTSELQSLRHLVCRL